MTPNKYSYLHYQGSLCIFNLMVTNLIDLNLLPDDAVDGELLLQRPVALQHLLLQGQAVKLGWGQSGQPGLLSKRESESWPREPARSERSCSGAGLWGSGVSPALPGRTGHSTGPFPSPDTKPHTWAEAAL